MIKVLSETAIGVICFETDFSIYIGAFATSAVVYNGSNIGPWVTPISIVLPVFEISGFLEQS